MNPFHGLQVEESNENTIESQNQLRNSCKKLRNKSLKFADFSYDESSKTFTITDKNGNQVELNKIYSFAFMRFVIRIAQRNWLRTKKVVDTTPEPMLDLPELEADAVIDLQQSLQFEDHETKYETSSPSEGIH